jgi:hypothetical protein
MWQNCFVLIFLFDSIIFLNKSNNKSMKVLHYKVFPILANLYSNADKVFLAYCRKNKPFRQIWMHCFIALSTQFCILWTLCEEVVFFNWREEQKKGFVLKKRRKIVSNEKKWEIALSKLFMYWFGHYQLKAQFNCNGLWFVFAKFGEFHFRQSSGS